ncbi:hypothetical protein D6856_03340 [Butyrivibrio sp. XB500-5]|uniref:hypothetical protein n=1 Tax=Butyrivibrio sp. XB500-5 TaxID=2364880 RepID=UPI000EAA3B39|nr:hypothetical protein [Butyrivibrio sp. XB500-5]RKM63172.1 hypothetical protein D6856_03340 [Butyrivibrio sp. XB500-5]
MNKQKLMVPLCLASAGMLAVTGLLGVQMTGRQKITETVEYVMEENNDSGLAFSSENDYYFLTEYTNIYDVLESRFGDESSAFVVDSNFGRLHYDGAIYGIAKHTNGFYSVFVFTRNENGYLQCIGLLRSDSPIRCDVNRLWLFNTEGAVNRAVETYAVSDDGKRLLHVEYIRQTFKDNVFYAYYNPSTHDNNQRTKFSADIWTLMDYMDRYANANAIF